MINDSVVHNNHKAKSHLRNPKCKNNSNCKHKEYLSQCQKLKNGRLHYKDVEVALFIWYVLQRDGNIVGYGALFTSTPKGSNYIRLEEYYHTFRLL